jgi:hypothetical protein
VQEFSCYSYRFVRSRKASHAKQTWLLQFGPPIKDTLCRIADRSDPLLKTAHIKLEQIKAESRQIKALIIADQIAWWFFHTYSNASTAAGYSLPLKYGRNQEGAESPQ